MNELRCGNCKHWLGEASEPMLYLEHVDRGPDTSVSQPRDLRLCKSCNRVNVFVPRSALDTLMQRAVNSA